MGGRHRRRVELFKGGNTHARTHAHTRSEEFERTVRALWAIRDLCKILCNANEQCKRSTLCNFGERSIFINVPLKTKRELSANLWHFSTSGWDQFGQYLMKKNFLPLPVPSRQHNGLVASRRCRGRRLPRIDEWEGIRPQTSIRNMQPREAMTEMQHSSMRKRLQFYESL